MIGKQLSCGRLFTIYRAVLLLGAFPLLHSFGSQIEGFVSHPHVFNPEEPSVRGNETFQKTFKLEKEYVLEKKAGTVNQLVVDKEGYFWIRDWDEGKIEKYDQNGKLVSAIGSAGRGPGRFLLLTGFAVDEERAQVFAIDLQQYRVNLFAEDGRFLDSWIVARPGYMPQAIVLDSKRGFYYLGGSLPLKKFVSEGALHVHKYKIGTNQYLGSFLETDRSVHEKNLFNYLVVSSLDIDSLGHVYCTLAPVYKVFKIDTQRRVIHSFVGRHRFYKAPPLYQSGLKPQDLQKLRKTWTQTDRVVIVGRFAILSLEVHEPFPYGLEVFDLNGNVLRTDLLTNGRLVGKDHGGGLYFALSQNGRYVIAKYRLILEKTGQPLRRGTS